MLVRVFVRKVKRSEAQPQTGCIFKNLNAQISRTWNECRSFTLVVQMR